MKDNEDSNLTRFESTRRQKENCAACLEPQDCDCMCATCVASRLEYKEYVLGMLIIEPRD